MRIDAPVYVPLAQRHVELEAAEIQETSLLDLGLDVLRHIIEQLNDIQDVISCIISCRTLKQEAAAARFSLDLHSDSHASPSSSIVMSLMIKSMTKYLSMVTSLDLSNLPLDSQDVDTILARIPHLRNLQLSGCKQFSHRSALFNSVTPLRPANLCELDLQRCFQLTAGCLKSLLTSTVPWHSLQCLSLSHLFFLPKGPLTSSTPTLKMLALNNCTQMDLEGLLFIADCTPNLTHLGLGGSTFSSDSLKQHDDLDHEEDTAMKGTHPIARIIFSVTCSLPHLEVIELTFTGSDIINSLQKAVAPHVQVLDLSTSKGVSSAVQCLREDKSSKLSMMLNCAAKCKSSSRKSITPLHLASHIGDVAMGTDLVVKLGASIDARDASGAVSIFVACEHGHADMVHALLDLGANSFISNSDGESCLYIAALKGHVGCVKALLSASPCKWTDFYYSDGWTPLHAACIGWSESHQKHLTIARLLLDFAASPDEACRMLSLANRYGQSAIHLAARKSAVLLEFFFSRVADAGHGRIVQLATQLDANRCRPIDIAAQNSNSRAIEILQPMMFSIKK